MLYFSITPTVFPEIIFAHQFAQENYHYNFTCRNPNVEIAYVKIGDIMLTIGNIEYRVEEGSFILLPHNCNFSINAISKKIHVHYTLNLHICNEIIFYNDLDSIPANNTGLLLPVILPPCTHSEELFQRLNLLIEEHHKIHPDRKYKCACKAFELLCDISALSQSKNMVNGPHSKHSANIHCIRIREYIQKNLGQPITLSDLSVFLDKSPNYLNRIFKEENGITIQQYVNREKIKKCIELMTIKGFTLTQCCEYVGIKDPNYLSRLFKKHMGISASQFKLNSVYSTFPLVDRDKL